MINQRKRAEEMKEQNQIEGVFLFSEIVHLAWISFDDFSNPVEEEERIFLAINMKIIE